MACSALITLERVFIAHADGNRRGRVFTSVCFSHNISTRDVPRITKRDTKVFHDESWQTIYFEVKRSKVKVTCHKNIAGVDLCTLVSAGFF